MAIEVVERENAHYLARLIEDLGACSMAEAMNAYKLAEKCGAADDWFWRELGKVDLFFLLHELLRRPDIEQDWLYARCREVEKSPDGHLDLWAREHYKSTIITFGLTIQDILIDPEVTVGIFSHTRPAAKTFLRQIKTEFETNEQLKLLYPDVLWANPQKDAPKWSEDEGIVVRRSGNPKEATVEAWGLIDGMPTGKHFRELIYDDVVTEGSVNTPEMMQKTTDKLRLSYSLGVEDGVRRFIGTRYHFNDSYRELIDAGTAKPRIYQSTKDGSVAGEPVLLSRESLAKKRRDMGVYIFACQMLQNPRADATHGFKREWLEYWTPDAGAGLNKMVIVDPANSKKAAADYTSMWVLGLAPDENFYILEMVRDRLNLTERTERLFGLVRKWKPLEVRYEEYGLQADIEHIKTEQDRQKYRFKITKVGGKARKEERIKRLVPLFENHRVILPHTMNVTNVEGETQDLVHVFVEQEYMAFPVPVHDDMLDALARVAEPDLKLKWPEKRLPINVPIRRIQDRAVGY